MFVFIIMVQIKRGLLIGINYTGTNSALRGCINDQENLAKFLHTKSFLDKKDLILMNDFQKGDLYPTKLNILNQLNSLVEFCNNKNKKDEILLVFAYSGHGSYVRDNSGDELDGKDEVICPIDYSTGGVIKDDNIKRYFIDRLGNNVKIIMLMDCCHSGTIVDLKYNYTMDKKDSCIVYGNCKDNKCKVVMISGCLDKQTSADAYIKDNKSYEYQGAMTACFLKCYNIDISYKDLIKRMRVFLKNGKYEQIPQLSTSFSIEVDDKFLLDDFNN